VPVEKWSEDHLPADGVSVSVEDRLRYVGHHDLGTWTSAVGEQTAVPTT
jgi:hypothetical protein